jgi:CubicO group peptidase (beta-lactamase class C family)
MTPGLRSLVVVAAAALGVAAPSPIRQVFAQSPASPDLAAIRAIVEAPIKAGKVAGASVAVARQGQMILSQSFGQADLELDVPMPADASFEIGSVTKQFTAASILLLAERGKLAIDDDMTKYLPDVRFPPAAVPPAATQRITIRHLLTHTSGIKGYTELPEFRDLMPLRKSPETLVKLFADKPLDFAPGENLVYNNSAFFLLGLIIEKASGQKYADFVKTNLFDKVGMPGSYYCSESAVHHHHAHGYDTIANTLILKGAISHAWPFSAGSLCSTAADLTAWNFALHGGRVLTADSYRAMTTGATLNEGSKTRYGFGIGLGDIRGRHAIAHGGGINGFLSEVEYYPDSGVSIVILINTAGSVGPGLLAGDIADVLLGKVARPSRTYAGDLSAFAGTFEGVGRGRPTAVTITVDNGKLMMTGGGAEPRALEFTNGETFAAGETLVIFEREGGPVVRLRLDSGGGYYILKKRPGTANP